MILTNMGNVVFFDYSEINKIDLTKMNNIVRTVNNMKYRMMNKTEIKEQEEYFYAIDPNQPEVKISRYMTLRDFREHMKCTKHSLVGMIGHTGKKVHKYEVYAYEKNGEMVIVSASSHCGSAKFNSAVLLSFDESKITCSKCLNK